MQTSYQFDFKDGLVSVSFPDGREASLGTTPLPEPFLQWQAAARIKMFEVLQQAGAAHVRSMPGHLPTMATVSDGLFPVNLSTRGFGVLPKASRLADITALFEAARMKAASDSSEKSLSDRVAAVREFYSDYNNFDPCLLGGLEIFEGEGARNIMSRPFVSLLYSGEAPRFPSYQFNGVIRVVSEGDPHYHFLLAARELFAFDAFHIRQPRYPFGYLFYPVESKDKTPFPRGSYEDGKEHL